MKQGWEIKKLGEVCEIKPPKRLAKGKLSENDLVTFFPMKDLKQFNHYITPIKTKYLKDVYGGYVYFENNDVLLAKITPCFENGKLGIAKDLKNGIGFGSSEYMVFRPKVGIFSEYIYYFLSLENIRREGKERMTGAVGHKRIPVDYLSNQNLITPPLPEQKRIVAILDKAFAAIVKAKTNAEQNLKNAKELFESYLQGVFENKGEGWKEKKWGAVCHFVRGPFGRSLKKSIFVEDGYVVYEQKHAIHNHFNELRYFIDENKFNEMKRFEVKPGDIIMSCSGVTLGRVAVIPENIKKGIINQALLKLTPNKNISVHFLKHWLRSKIFQNIIFKHSGGAAIPNVPGVKILKEIIIPLPNIKEQDKMVRNIELLLAETKKLETIYQQKIDDLEELKKSILQKAFNGEL